ncbi:uncharacterized protein An12g08460 [Aspergillus niger]|uniref:Contig An12c0280, genomic contig n=2 Tax=Aspergillus niger TaxID=5061 RepID=A2R0F8_ASPNC|nr:uncharacterized protein An12g08460 [Aspergillus niger]CAK41296.1 unnamed protein product [Aspergillus niger]
MPVWRRPKAVALGNLELPTKRGECQPNLSLHKDAHKHFATWFKITISSSCSTPPQYPPIKMPEAAGGQARIEPIMSVQPRSGFGISLWTYLR